MFRCDLAKARDELFLQDEFRIKRILHTTFDSQFVLRTRGSNYDDIGIYNVDDGSEVASFGQAVVFAVSRTGHIAYAPRQTGPDPNNNVGVDAIDIWSGSVIAPLDPTVTTTTAITVSHSGRFLAYAATSGSVNQVKVIDLNSGLIVKTYNRTANATALSVAVTHDDGNVMIVEQTTTGNTITSWNLTDNVRRTYPSIVGVFSVTSLYTPGLLIGASVNKFHWIDVASGTPIRTVNVPAQVIQEPVAVAARPNGTEIAVVAGDGYPRIYDAASGALLRVVTLPVGTNSNWVFTGTGKFLVTSKDEVAGGGPWSVINAATGDVVRTIPGRSFYYLGGSKPKTEIVASGTNGFTISLVDTASGEIVQTLNRGYMGSPRGAFSPDGSLYADYPFNVLTLFRLSDGAVLSQTSYSNDVVCEFSPYNRIYGVVAGATIRIYDVDSRNLIWSKNLGGVLYQCGFTRDGKYVLTSDNTTKSIYVLDRANGEIVRQVFFPGVNLPQFEVSPASNYAVVDRGFIYEFLNIDTGVVDIQMDNPNAGYLLFNIGFSPSGATLLHADQDLVGLFRSPVYRVPRRVSP